MKVILKKNDQQYKQYNSKPEVGHNTMCYLKMQLLSIQGWKNHMKCWDKKKITQRHAYKNDDVVENKKRTI